MQDVENAPDQDNKDQERAVIRDLARALFAADMEDRGDAEARKAAWTENKTAMMSKARKVMRRLKANGITLSKSE